MPSSATSAGRGSASPSWGIEQECPQCGAPVCLDETDRLLVCDYCRVRLILAGPGIVRTFLAPRNASPDGLVFVPYWRMKGQAWSFRTDGMRSSIVDMTGRATDCPGLPASLGVRPQAMRLRFVTPETPGRFARTCVPLEEALSLRWKGLDDLDEDPPFHRILVGETASVIYQPVRVGARIEDAILDRAIAPRSERMPDIDPEASEGAIAGTRFLSTVCPNCGGDLEGERQSLVQICGGCSTAWTAGREVLERCPCEVLPSAFSPDIHLPFWRTEAEVDGIPLGTYGDLLRHANLPALGRSSRREARIAFWTPAFKIHPEHWARVARTVTLRQPGEATEAASSASAAGIAAPSGEVVPVTLPAEGAAAAVRVLIAATAGVKEVILRKIEKITVRATRPRLVYLPFRAGPHEITHPEMLVALSRNLLSFGRNL